MPSDILPRVFAGSSWDIRTETRGHSLSYLIWLAKTPMNITSGRNWRSKKTNGWMDGQRGRENKILIHSQARSEASSYVVNPLRSMPFSPALWTRQTSAAAAASFSAEEYPQRGHDRNAKAFHRVPHAVIPFIWKQYFASVVAFLAPKICTTASPLCAASV